MTWPWTVKEQVDDDTRTKVRRLESRMLALETEWSDVVDKLLHRIQRQTKRDRDALKASADPLGIESAQEEAPQPAFPKSGRAALRARLYRRMNGLPR